MERAPRSCDGCLACSRCYQRRKPDHSELKSTNRKSVERHAMSFPQLKTSNPSPTRKVIPSKCPTHPLQKAFHPICKSRSFLPREEKRSPTARYAETLIPRCPKGREDTENQVKRLLQAHEIILLEARAMARESAEHGDLGTNDIIVSNLIRLNELQVWFIVEHIQ